MDFNADLCFKKCLREVIDRWGEPNLDEWAYWKLCTEKMLNKMPVAEVVNKVLEVAEGISDREWKGYYPSYIFEEKKEEKPIKVYGKSKADILIKDKLKITEVAKKYGLKVKHNKVVCPFHDDTDPSLSLSDEKNVFFCHGCHAKGDVITFIKKMEGKNGNKK